MTAKEALKRLKQETAPATYMPDFDKDECIEIIQKEFDKLEKDNENLLKLNAEAISESIDIHNKNVTLKLKLEQLEKELKQTKLNFRNSQTHSKNCYKKLKEKYTRLKRAYKNNEVLVRDLNELINRNLELRKQIENLEEENQGVKDDNTRLWHSLECANNENAKLKQAIKILKEKFDITVDNTFYPGIIIAETNELGNNDCVGDCLSQEQYELLKQVFEGVGDSDE